MSTFYAAEGSHQGQIWKKALSPWFGARSSCLESRGFCWRIKGRECVGEADLRFELNFAHPSLSQLPMCTFSIKNYKE